MADSALDPLELAMMAAGIDSNAALAEKSTVDVATIRRFRDGSHKTRISVLRKLASALGPEYDTAAMARMAAAYRDAKSKASA